MTRGRVVAVRRARDGEIRAIDALARGARSVIDLSGGGAFFGNPPSIDEVLMADARRVGFAVHRTFSKRDVENARQMFVAKGSARTKR